MATLAPPEHYNAGLSDWSRTDLLPLLPEQFAIQITRIEAVANLKALVANSDQIVVATDSTREGEANAASLLTVIGWTRPALRLWGTSMAKSAIARAIDRLSPWDPLSATSLAGALRAEADWVEGMNASRAVAAKIRWQGMDGRRIKSPRVSIGRVQTAALAIVARREALLSPSITERGFGYAIDFLAPEGEVTLIQISARPETDRGAAESFRRELDRVRQGRIEVTRSNEEVPAPQPFDTTLLEITAELEMGWSADRVMKAARQLHECGAITQPRTESRLFTPGVVSRWSDTWLSLAKAGFVSQSRVPILPPGGLRSQGTARQGAIAPTGEPPDRTTLPADAAQLYTMIVAQCIMSCGATGYDTLTRAEYDHDGAHIFVGTRRDIAEAGWREGLSSTKIAATLNGQADASGQPRHGDDRADGFSSRDVDINGTLPKELSNCQVDALRSRTFLVRKDPMHALSKTAIRGLLEDVTPLLDEQTRNRLGPGPHGIGAPSTRTESIGKLLSREMLYIDPSNNVRLGAAGSSVVKFLDKAAPELLDLGASAAFERMLRDVESGLVPASDARRVLMSRTIGIVRKILNAEPVTGHAFGPNRPGPTSARDNHAALAQPEVKAGQGGKTTHPSRRSAPASAVWLQIPYSQREAAKAAGARWDAERQQWWMPVERADMARMRRSGWVAA